MTRKRSNSKPFPIVLLALIVGLIYYLRNRKTTGVTEQRGVMEKVIGEKEIFAPSRPAAATAVIGKEAAIKAPVVNLFQPKAGIPFATSSGSVLPKSEVKPEAKPINQAVAAASVIIGQAAAVKEPVKSVTTYTPFSITTEQSNKNITPIKTVAPSVTSKILNTTNQLQPSRVTAASRKII